MKNQRTVLKIFWYLLLVSILTQLILLLNLRNFVSYILIITFELLSVYLIAILFMNVIEPKSYYKNFKTFIYTSCFILFYESILIISFSFEMTRYIAVITATYLFPVEILGGIVILILSFRKLFKVDDSQEQ